MNERLPLPIELNADAFKIIDYAIERFSEIFECGDIKQPITWLGTIRVYFGLRAYNLLKCVRHLIGYGYWEECNILLRTMFEFLLRLEDVERGDSEEKAQRFARFALASDLVHRRNAIVYDYETGRIVDASLIKYIDDYLQTHLREFLDEKALGKRYLKTKSDKKVYALVQESAKAKPLREHQYHTLYSRWCEYVHGLPPAILGDLKVLYSLVSTDGILEKDKREWRNIIALAVTLAIEILFLTKDALPVRDLDGIVDITERAKQLLLEDMV